MIVLNKDVEEITFEDVELFCSEKHPEGLQIDYKVDLTNKNPNEKGLAKHFAAFSNTRGGVIIIGVQEDKTNYTPLTWEGIDKSHVGTYKDKIHAWAKNVEPYLTYKIGITNEKNGKVFLLIRILEGDNTPYYIQNHSEIYMRTEDTSDKVKLASPEAQRLLFAKKQEADAYRKIQVSLANNIYSASVKKYQDIVSRRLLSDTATYKKNHVEDPELKNFKPEYFTGRVGDPHGDCLITLQPHYPAKSLVDLSTLFHSIDNLAIRSTRAGTFPGMDGNAEKGKVPEGILYFKYLPNNGFIHCTQIFSKGLLFNKIQLASKYIGGIRKFGDEINLEVVAEMFYQTLEFGRRLYEQAGYQGSLKGTMSLEGVEGTSMYPVEMSSSEDIIFPLLDSYTWEINLDSNILSSHDDFIEYYYQFFRRFYWDIGYEGNVTKDRIIKSLQDNKWI